MTREQKAVIRAAMRLYRHWVRLGAANWTPNDYAQCGHWFPLCSKKQAKALGKACAALSRKRRARRG